MRAAEEMAEAEALHLVLIDLDKVGWSSLSVLEARPRGRFTSPVIALVNPETVQQHRSARYFKIRDFLVRPVSWVEVEMALDRCVENERLRRENVRLRQESDRYRMELVRSLIENPLGAVAPEKAESSPEDLQDAVDRSRRENRWKKLLHGEEDLSHLMETIIQLVTGEWKASRASLMLFDRSDGHLKIRQAAGLDEAIIDQTRVRLGQGPSGYVAETRKPLLVQDPLDYVLANWPQRHEHPSFASIPLVCAGELLGVLNVTGKNGGGEFTEEEMESLTAFGSTATEALDRLIVLEGLKEGYLATIKALALAIERKDPYTTGHSNRVCEYSLAIGRAMGLAEKQLEVLEAAAILHDVGKIGIPLSIVHKPGALSRDEVEELRQHPLIGSQLLGCLNHLKSEEDIVRHHHEWWNGEGYPDGLRGEDLSIGARIVAVADAYDAMTTHRSYRRAIESEAAFQEILSQSGAQFDPEVVRVFAELWNSRSGKLLLAS